MKTFQAKVYVQNGNARVAHTVQFNANSPFAALQMLRAQYGANNVINNPTEVLAKSMKDPAPWMKKIG